MSDPAEYDAVMAYQFETKPYHHQMDCLKKSWNREEYALLLEMGTGKTKIILDNACILFEEFEIGALLVLAPNSVYRNWLLREIPTHVPERIQKVMRTFVYKRDKLDRLTAMLTPEPFFNVLLFNIEAFSVRGDLLILLQAWMNLMPTMMVVDESTMIKSAKSKRTKNIIALGKMAKYRRIATGLVAPHGPTDVFPQFQFLKEGCLGFNNPVSFRLRYCRTVPIDVGGRSMDKIVGVQREEELRSKMRKFSYRKRKDECLDLPEKIYNFHYSELDDETRGHYDKMVKKAIFELEHEDPEQSVFVRNKNRLSMVMRLQMITCGHIKDEDGKSHRFSTKRIMDTLEFLDSVDGQVVIWSVFVRDVEDLVHHIKKEFGESSVLPFYGETSVLERDEAITSFQEGRTRYLVSSTAGRFGTTLTAASTAFYYSNSYNLEFRVQSEDRIHRIGQHHPCLYVDALAPNTVNLPLIHNLRHKIDVSTAINGDSYRKWLVNRDE